MSPVFFVGPRKTGTSSFHEVFLKAGLPVSKEKETFFFDAEEPNLSAYEGRFGLDPAKRFVEVSPSYFANEVARRNLKRLFPDALIVITLRHPGERARSALSHARRDGRVSGSINEIAYEKAVRNIIRGSSYSGHVKAWKEAFPGRILLLRQSNDGTFGDEAITAMSEAVGADVSALKSVRANPARVARSATLAKGAVSAKTFLRKRGGDAVVRALRPLNRVLFKSAAPDDSKAFFNTALASEIAFYATLPAVSRL